MLFYEFKKTSSDLFSNAINNLEWTPEWLTQGIIYLISKTDDNANSSKLPTNHVYPERKKHSHQF